VVGGWWLVVGGLWVLVVAVGLVGRALAGLLLA